MNILFDDIVINNKVCYLASCIDRHYRDREPILIGVLSGSFIFLADLCRELTINHKIDFIAVKSYLNNKQCKDIEWIKKPSYNLSQQEIIIVEDMVDSGNTIKLILEELSKYDPKSVSVCTLCYKQKVLKNVNIQYKGFEINEDDFIYGYGMDNLEFSRNLNYICKL